MNYKQYVKKHGSMGAKKLTSKSDFPIEADWRALKLFINQNYIPDLIVTELENLHDLYYLGVTTHE